MSRARTHTAMPVTVEARERLRDQQRQEAIQLEAVLAAQRRLVTQREKADRAIAKAEQDVAAKQAAADHAVAQLVETSGLIRTAVLLGRTKCDIARIARVGRRSETRGGCPPARAEVSA